MADAAARTIDVTVHYLEMCAPPHRAAPAPAAGVEVVRVLSPSVAHYRFLYDAVGRDLHWVDRKKLSDDELAAIVQDPANELYVLHVDGAPAGMAELDRRRRDEIELAYFGLMPEFRGRGLGRWLLDWIIDRAWSYAPRRLWLHTCTLDHPAALPLYRKAGFVPYREEACRQEL